MAQYIAFDTSNYTTSVAVYDDDTRKVVHFKKLLPVKSGERGIRQSDAVFHHTQQLMELVPSAVALAKETFNMSSLNIAAVGVSVSPRRAVGSYMPCFTVGSSVAHSVSSIMDKPLYEFSHQEGHVAAALYSADKLSLMGTEFLAFHVSGGTTESLIIRPTDDCIITATEIGTSTDLKAGQAIDRVGVMLGLNFPCGVELEKLAKTSNKIYKIKPSVKDMDCSFSGVENKCKKMISDGEPREDIALFCIKSIEAGLLYMTNALREKYPTLPVVYSGGVMSNSIMRGSLKSCGESYFATPEFSSDNAAGIAVLTAWKDKIWKQ